MPFTPGQSGNPKTQFKPGKSGNPAGKPKGAKNLSTWIQELMNDESFISGVLDKREGYKEITGAPIKAIILAALHKAIAGDEKSREWLAKYGYGTKITVQNTGNEAEAWFQSLDQQEQELADGYAAEFTGSPEKQKVAPGKPLQDKE